MYNGDECSWTTSCKYDYLNRLTQIKTLNYLEGKEHSETLSKTRYYGWSNTPRYASEKNVQNGVVRSEWVTKCYKSGAISEVMYKSYNENGKMSYYHFSSMNEDMSPIDRETVNYHDNGCVKHHEVELYRDGILRLREETYYTQSGKISEYYKTVYDKNGKIEFETVEIYEQTTTNTESMPEPIETESDTEVEESLLVESESVITE